VAVAAPLLTAPVPDRANWTLPRLQAEIARDAEVSISKSHLGKTLKKTAIDGAGRATASPDGRTPMPSIVPDFGSSS
jgi:hypothetical protein